jgi:uncharacterized protein YkwD
MSKKIIMLLLFTNLLTACIGVSTNSATPTPVEENFVTATLIPTKAGFVPATLTPTPENTAAPTLNATAAADCKDSAILLKDVTVPDNTQMKAGEKFTKTWEFQNNGTCPWSNYTLKFSFGDKMNAPLSAPIADTAPKKNVDVSVELTAPTTNGAFTGNFTLNDASGNAIPIGIEKTFWVKIKVGNDTAQATSVSGANTPFVPAGGNSNCNYTPNDGYVSELISLINQARSSANLPALTINSQLMAAAQGHSSDMACNNFIDHAGSDGSWIGDRLLRAGYPANTYYSEIIAIGTPRDAMSQWQADVPHWNAVLDPSVKEIGAGYAYYQSSDFNGYITVDMGGQ